MNDLKSRIKNLIEKNDVQGIEDILSNDEYLQTLKQLIFFDPFVLSIKFNRIDLIKFFHAKGFQINICFKTNSSENKSRKKRKLNEETKVLHKKYEISFAYSNCLIEAIKCQNIAAINTLIDLNVNVNSTDYKQIPIQIAYNFYRTSRKKDQNKHQV